MQLRVPREASPLNGAVGFPGGDIQESCRLPPKHNGEIWLEGVLSTEMVPKAVSKTAKAGGVDTPISPGPALKPTAAVSTGVGLVSSDSVSARRGPRALLCSGGRTPCWTSEDVGENLMVSLAALWPWKTSALATQDPHL